MQKYGRIFLLPIRKNTLPVNIFQFRPIGLPECKKQSNDLKTAKTEDGRGFTKICSFIKFLFFL
jgi:hypothetical protein